MSKSVKSHQSGTSKRPGQSLSVKEAQHSEIKERIKEILMTVKEERQHIENLLHENDLQIHDLRQQYEMTRYQNDFDNLSSEELTILNQLSEGLKEMSIEPTQILGNSIYLKEEEGEEERRLSSQQILRVQQVVIDRLQEQLLLRSQK